MKILIETLDKQIEETEIVWQQKNQQKLSVEKALEVMNDELSQLKGRRTALLETKELLLKQMKPNKVMADPVTLKPLNNQLPK